MGATGLIPRSTTAMAVSKHVEHCHENGDHMMSTGAAIERQVTGSRSGRSKDADVVAISDDESEEPSNSSTQTADISQRGRGDKSPTARQSKPASAEEQQRQQPPAISGELGPKARSNVKQHAAGKEAREAPTMEGKFTLIAKAEVRSYERPGQSDKRKSCTRIELQKLSNGTYEFVVFDVNTEVARTRATSELDVSICCV
jgi:hypothetical protein